MTPFQHAVLDTVFALLGGIVGCLLCREHFRFRAWEYYEALRECEQDREDAEDILEDFRVASRQVVQELEEVGDNTDWRDGPETDRIYPWYEIEPLAKCLKRLEDRERRIAETPS